MGNLIITAAITGSIHTPSMSPYLPITPDQIAENAIGACKAGAAVVHIHVRNPQTGQPTSDPELFRQVFTKIKNNCDVVIMSTTGGSSNMTMEQRIAVIPMFKPEIASFNAGTVNLGAFEATKMKINWKNSWEKPYLLMAKDTPFANTWTSLEEYAKTFEANNTKAELEIYDVAMLSSVDYLIRKGFLKKPVQLQFVMGILGGIPATIPNLQFLYQTAKEYFGNEFVWSVCATGRNQFRIGTVAMLMGGNVRVGMEDSLFVGKGIMAKNNAEQVEKMVRIANEFDVEIATPSEARQILGLKGIDKVNY
ncbi:MAG: 3-keto-5-aminohexanoate cleavage protein [Dehalococcoidales bacterium]|nr:3-keto-5-aminohexanoate cleavage protein [Dehalococcoidales bacterium]